MQYKPLGYVALTPFPFKIERRVIIDNKLLLLLLYKEIKKL